MISSWGFACYGGDDCGMRKDAETQLLLTSPICFHFQEDLLGKEKLEQPERKMACSKKRKVDSENRSFKDEWKDKYAFIPPAKSSKPICLTCSESIAVVKSGNVKHHYETKHGNFEKNYPQNTETRTRKVNQLKLQYERSTNVLTNSMTLQERAVECSLKVAWILGRHKKPFSDAETVKECMLEVTETLFEGKQKDDIKDKIKQIPLSDSTAMRRTAILAEDLTSQLDNAMQNASCISVAVDESTDATDSAQLLVFVRFYDIAQKGFCEDLLGVASLEARIRGEDIYEAMKMMLTERGLDLKSVVSITTDGAPSMIGRERGLVGRLKEDHPDLISYHCIIHQSILCASFGGDYAVIMEKIMKLANFLRASSSLQHRLLRNFLSEVSGSYDDLLLHNNVRWLSKGKVLERFWSIRKEVQEFLRSQQSAAKANKFLEFLEDEKEMEKKHS